MKELKTVEQIEAEITQLEKDLAMSPVADKAIIQEEIDRLKKLQANEDSIDQLEQAGAVSEVAKGPAQAPTAVGNELTPNVASTELSPEDQALLDEARAETGEDKRGNFLNVDELVIINRTEEKEVNGEMVTPRPEQIFTVKSYDAETKTYPETPFMPEFSGQLLKVRFKIESKFGTPKWFGSNEFSDFSLDRVVAKTGRKDGSEILYSGSYGEAKEQLLMQNKKGETVKAFDLYAMVYIEVGEKMYKLKTKIGKDAPLFIYTKSFGEGTFLACKTNFSLVWKEVTATVKFWEVVYEKGEASNLKENLAKVKEMNQVFRTMDGQPPVNQTPQVTPQAQDMPVIDGPEGQDYSQPEPNEIPIDDDEINVDEIPF